MSEEKKDKRIYTYLRCDEKFEGWSGHNCKIPSPCCTKAVIEALGELRENIEGGGCHKTDMDGGCWVLYDHVNATINEHIRKAGE